jgi:hypothetical protein
MERFPRQLADIVAKHGGPSLSDIAARMRGPDQCLTPEAMGAQKATRLSFTQSLGRKMIEGRWRLTTQLVDFDANGIGKAVYEIDFGKEKSTYIVRSFEKGADGENIGRRGGAKRDLYGALFFDVASPERIAEEFAVIETRDRIAMRSKSDVLGWTPGTRSARVFEDVVEALANGEQPANSIVRKSGYLIRNGGFIAGGRHGTKSYAGIPDGHPLKSPYFADLFALLLMRGVSVDLVNAMAAARSSKAVALSENLTKYFGVGNASGQGMCVALQRWPQWFSTWTLVREFCLGRALAVSVKPSSPERQKMLEYLSRAIGYYDYLTPELENFMVPYEEIVRNLTRIKAWVEDDKFFAEGSWEALVRHVDASVDRESAETFNALLIEIYPEFADDVAAYVPVGMARQIEYSPEKTVGEFRARYLSQYHWVLRHDMRHSDEHRHFWYHSIEHGEQRRGERIIDPHEHFESFIDHISAIQRLAAVLASYDDTVPMAFVMMDFPELAFAAARVESLALDPYKEIHGNLLHKDFSPAQLIRFYLSNLGLESTYPLSIRWVPGVLFQGFPTWKEVAAGLGGDWKFTNVIGELV